MSQSESNPSKQTSRSVSSSSSVVDDNGHSRFTFVTEKNQPGARTHAMRAHWQERRRRNLSQGGRVHDRTRRPLRSKPKASGSGSASQDENLQSTAGGTPTQVSMHVQDPGFYMNPFGVAEQQYSPKEKDPMSYITPGLLQGIPAQFLTGVNFALSSSRLDPFDVFPVTLTTEHHKLIHHCTSSLVCC